jgi:hypothetical protein
MKRSGIAGADPINGIEKYRTRLLRFIQDNPLFTQYAQHINAPNQQTNTSPWHAMGERNYAAYLCVLAATEHRIKVYGVRPDVHRESTLVATAFMILNTTPYLWSDPMEKLADAAPMPKHVISRNVMPCPAMFWSRETAYRNKDTLTGTLCENNWIAVIYSGEYMITIGDWFDVEKQEMTICHYQIPFGKTWPSDFKNDKEVEIILKRCAFLASPYVDSNPVRLARHHRRQMERAHIPPAQRDEPIHVVKLRHKAAAKPAQPEPGDNPVDWKHQWWVQAHYRAQWYPSERAHKVIWIAPFLKGPAGLPVLEKVYAVVR